MIELTLQHLATNLAGHKVTFSTDNKAALSFVNRERAPNEELLKLIKSIALTCLSHNITVEAEYIPGHLNFYADAISRFDERNRIFRFMDLIMDYHGP